jgi:plasmid stabilization system protein ParE
MRVDFLDAARDEVGNAVDWYDQQQEGLGGEFLNELRLTTERIKEFPGAWPRSSRNSRRCRMSRFPYAVVYQLFDDRISIIAVMHLSRKPGHWQSREDKK